MTVTMLHNRSLEPICPNSSKEQVYTNLLYKADKDTTLDIYIEKEGTVSISTLRRGNRGIVRYSGACWTLPWSAQGWPGQQYAGCPLSTEVLWLADFCTENGISYSFFLRSPSTTLIIKSTTFKRLRVGSLTHTSWHEKHSKDFFCFPFHTLVVRQPS